MSVLAERLQNYGTEGPHVSFGDRLPWNRGKLQPVAQAVHNVEEEFAKHKDEFRHRGDFTEYAADGSKIRIERAGKGFSLTRRKYLSHNLIAGEIVRLSDEGKITSVEGLIDGWAGYKVFPISPKESVAQVLAEIRTDLSTVMAERAVRISQSPVV